MSEAFDHQGRPAGLFAAYAGAPGAYDEFIGKDGFIRPHWAIFADLVSGMPAAHRQASHQIAERLLHQNGVTYMAADPVEGGHAPWALDLMPLLISETEWRGLERGLVQRATLLNAIAADVYGPQKLLKDGKLPPPLVFGNPQFQRPCHGTKVPEDIYVHLMAFDLARAPDGQWWILNDRTQSPTGLGFALENRITTSRALADQFAGSNVRRLASFFQGFSDGFLKLAGKDEPMVVVLSPGPARETYFEHDYLARYLGYTVVEGADLTVRDNRVYLKTVEGLKQVDLIFRRVNTEWCDPLELRTDSLLGVPGLVNAARAGNVVIGNALGSGLLENDGLSSFLPGLSRHVLGEDLALPGVATWWCGQESERAYVLDHMHDLIVRKAFSPKSILEPWQDVYVGPYLSDQNRERLRLDIERQSHAYVGQEYVSLSTTPSWIDPNTVVPAPMTLRAFVAWTKDGYAVLPGGLSRVSRTVGGAAAPMAKGDYSKDTWIVCDEAADRFSLLPVSTDRPHFRRSHRDLPSRSADNLFWLGRYADRAESAVRLQRGLIFRLSGEFGPTSDQATLNLIIKLLVSQGYLSQRRARRVILGGVPAVERELWRIIFDPDVPDGLTAILENIDRVASLVRERLSADTWRILIGMYEMATDEGARSDHSLENAQAMLDQLIQQLSAFNGMVMENMTRGYSWRFLDMGRRLERAYRTSRMIGAVSDLLQDDNSEALTLLMDQADSSMTYRTRYKDAPRVPLVLDLLMADDSNPRSIAFQLETLKSHVAALPDVADGHAIDPAARVLERLSTDLRITDIPSLMEPVRRRGGKLHLDVLLDQITAGLIDLTEIVGRSYFIHTHTTRLGAARRAGIEE